MKREAGIDLVTPLYVQSDTSSEEASTKREHILKEAKRRFLYLPSRSFFQCLHSSFLCGSSGEPTRTTSTLAIACIGSSSVVLVFG